MTRDEVTQQLEQFLDPSLAGLVSAAARMAATLVRVETERQRLEQRVAELEARDARRDGAGLEAPAASSAAE